MSPPQKELVLSLANQLHNQPTSAYENDLPAYDFSNARRVVDQLCSESVPQSFHLGTGASIFASALLPAMLAAKQEVLFVTCFWAPSKSLSALAETLSRLAAMRRRQCQASPGLLASVSSPLRIRICLSSRTLAQKVFHTSSRDGYVYPPASWASKLGLPPAEELRDAGIDLTVKSIFFRPFSVMHPKYVVIDRQRVFLPSCNVSWEPWLEGCVELTGDAVTPLLSFYARTWNDNLPPLAGLDTSPATATTATTSTTVADTNGALEVSHVDVDGPGSIVVRFNAVAVAASTAASPVPTLILPSSHHINPCFRPFPWQASAPPPPTPLNLAMLHLFASAERQVNIYTPNLTAEAAIAALLGALGRGVDVAIVTCCGMMVYEQLLTAGTTTAWCIRSLTQRYESLRATRKAAADRPCGNLRISYYQPFLRRAAIAVTAHREASMAVDVHEEVGLMGQAAASGRRKNASGFDMDDDEPVQSHIKLTIVDGQHTVLGSGNMDRASWFTSQELGIMFHDISFATVVQTAVDRVLDGRLDLVYQSR